MRQSRLFGKTVKETPSSITMKSHELLYKAGFVRESRSGRYYFLPLGLRVQNKIIDLVRSYMNLAASQEVVAPTLHPIELWQETNRDNATGFELMRVVDRRGAEFALGGTAEEMFVDLVRQFQMSYKDLPFSLYQFSNKFRDELRARGGLLRVREFIMKDAYSFHSNEADFKHEYEKMWRTYLEIFKKLGLDALPVAADNGYIGGEYCHEFIVESVVGESRFFSTTDHSYSAHEDIAEFVRSNINPDDEIMPLTIVEQPEWVKTMDDNVKHYGLSKERFLKNVVYKNRFTNEIIIIVIRGDLEVNKVKVEGKLGMVGLLEEASEADLARFGSKFGYVHSWGDDGVKYVGDISVKTVKNFIGGQKTQTHDTINVNYDRDFKCEILDDFAMAYDGAPSIFGSPLKLSQGIEVGNIFQLGHHYSSKMQGASFINEHGESQPYYMGCYGIGIGRTLATIVEKFHDDRGIIWPEIIAPFRVHLLALGEDPQVIEEANRAYNILCEGGVEVLYDDRNISAGAKFADADLIGAPYRIVISKKTLAQGSFELKKRSEQEGCLYSFDKLESMFN